jgi:curved DNA-binding protein CbpA
MDTVKESYHRLMQKYHPDRFADDPEMQKKATELSQELTRAYEAVKRFKEKGRY